MSICEECLTPCDSYMTSNRSLWRKITAVLYSATILKFKAYCSRCRYKVLGDKNKIFLAKTAIVNNAFLNTNSGHITIEDWVFFGNNVSVITGAHDYNLFDKERQTSCLQGRDIIIRHGAWIGANATILGPCEIGENSVVGAGSVVTRSVSSHTVVAGNPARVIKKIGR